MMKEVIEEIGLDADENAMKEIQRKLLNKLRIVNMQRSLLKMMCHRMISIAQH